MRCFVTGATGFVGGHLCERLAREGHEVMALARAGSNRAVLEKAGVRVITGSVDSINVFAHYAQETDVFFHLAAVTKPVRSHDFAKVNADGTDRVLRGLRRGDFRGRFVLLSSLAAGGPAMPDRQGRTEEDPDQPVSRYGRSKLRAERLARQRLPKGCTWTALRPGAIYGPREHEILEVLRMIARKGIAIQFGTGVEIQLTHVEDVVEALLLAATRPEAADRVFHITERQVWRFDQIIDLAAEALGVPVRHIRLPMFLAPVIANLLDLASIVAGRSLAPFGRDKLREMRAGQWIADPTRAEQELGWQPRWRLTDGLTATVQWYRENKWL